MIEIEFLLAPPFGIVVAGVSLRELLVLKRYHISSHIHSTSLREWAYARPYASSQ